MSRFGIKVLKTVFVLSLISGTVAYASTQINSENANSTLETIEMKTESAMDWASEKKAGVKEGWNSLGVETKVKSLQYKTRPIGKKITAAVGPQAVPGVQAIQEGERRMSWPALLLIFVFGSIVFIMGRSGPSSMLGGRH